MNEENNGKDDKANSDTRHTGIALAKPMTWENIRSQYDPDYVKHKAEIELKDTARESKDFGHTSNVYKAFTLKEFENGMLLSETLKEEYRTFVIDLSRNIQKEYDCVTPSQRVTAESVACAYGRILQTSALISGYLGKDSVTDYGLKYLAIMSKELDRAHRHYTTTLQTLHMLKQPPLSVTVNANTANIANSQLIQQNTVVKSI